MTTGLIPKRGAELYYRITRTATRKRVTAKGSQVSREPAPKVTEGSFFAFHNPSVSLRDPPPLCTNRRFIWIPKKTQDALQTGASCFLFCSDIVKIVPDRANGAQERLGFCGALVVERNGQPHTGAEHRTEGSVQMVVRTA